MERLLQKQWDRLVTFFIPRSPKPSDEYINAWIRAMSRYEVRHVAKMVDHVEEWESPGRLPGLNSMVAVVDSIAANEREEAERRESKEGRRHDFLPEGDTEYARNCKMLIDALLTGAITRRQYLEGLEHLGLTKGRDDNLRYYAKHNLPLDSPALWANKWEKERGRPL